MTTFNLTIIRTAALSGLVDAAASHDATTFALDTATDTAVKAGFTTAHFASRGKGGAGKAGAAFDTAMAMAAVALLDDADRTIWAGPKSKDRTAISNRLSNWVARLAKRIDAAKEGKATGNAARGKSTKSHDDVVRDNIAAQRNYYTTALEQKSDAQRNRVAASGGEAQCKIYLASWDAQHLVYAK